MSGTPRLKHPSLCLRCQDLAEGREAAKEDGRQPRPWLLTPSSSQHDLVTGVKGRTSPPSEAKKTVATKPRATPAVLAGSGLLGSQACAVPGWPGAPALATVQCLLWAVTMPPSGISAREAQGQVWLSIEIPSLAWPPRCTFSFYPEGTDPQDFCPIEYFLVHGTFSI